MSPAAAELVEVGRLDERVEQLEAREDKQDGKLEELARTSAGIREELAGMRGEIRGALAASKMGGAIVGSLVSIGASAGIGLLLFLLGKK